MLFTYLDLSTGHLSRVTMDALERIDADHNVRSGNYGWPAMTVAAYEHGCFVTVPTDAEQEQWDALPTDLLSAITHARKLGAAVIRFDSDGETIDGLLVHDW
jgi:hypothetical protein